MRCEDARLAKRQRGSIDDIAFADALIDVVVVAHADDLTSSRS